MEHEIPFGNSNRENGTTFLEIFQWDEPTKRVPFTTEPEIPEILTKWKAPSMFFHKPVGAKLDLTSEQLAKIPSDRNNCGSI